MPTLSGGITAPRIAHTLLLDDAFALTQYPQQRLLFLEWCCPQQITDDFYVIEWPAEHGQPARIVWQGPFEPVYYARVHNCDVSGDNPLCLTSPAACWGEVDGVPMENCGTLLPEPSVLAMLLLALPLVAGLRRLTRPAVPSRPRRPDAPWAGTS